MAQRISEIEVKTRQVNLSITGMTCSSCVGTIEKALNKIPGVRAAVNLAMESAHVIVPLNISEEDLIAAVNSAGYKATSFKGERESFEKSTRLGIRLFVTLLFALPVLLISMIDELHKSIDEYLLNFIDYFNKNLSGANIDFEISNPVAPASTWLVLAMSVFVVLIMAWPIHRAALKNLINPTMDTLVSLGSLISLSWSVYAVATYKPEQDMLSIYTEVSASVIFFVMLGRYLEHRAKRSAGSALAELFKLSAGQVEISRDGGNLVIPIDELQVGDIFVVKPGDRIATDGQVVSGFTTINNAFLTGEAKPVEIVINDLVFAGSINNNGNILVRATRIGSDTELARITRMVLAAQSEKAPAQQLADRISRVFVPIVLVLSIITFIAWYVGDFGIAKSVTAAVAVLVIACPCALGLATPIALMVASGKAAKSGIIIRSPRAIEKALKITDAIFDKTGTITSGQMVLLEMRLINNPLPNNSNTAISTSDLLMFALSVESLDSHPIADAIKFSLEKQGVSKVPVSDFEHTAGVGVAARVNLPSSNTSKAVLIGSPLSIARATTQFSPEIVLAIESANQRANSVAVLAVDGLAYGVFEVGDQIKPESKDAIQKLHKAGINTWLVSGDSETSAISIGSEVGIPIDHIFATATPEDKLIFVENLQKNGKVLMIGDGINDAAAIAKSDLSIAMGSGTDTAIASADITLIRPSLLAVIDALDISKKSVRIIRSNLGWAFFYNIAFIPIAASGNLSPMYAAGAMSLSSLFVVFNSLRIK
ncbi:MAG: heavy metal translocating P-type ATPase [Candidatus Nanopelagicus sp.]